MVSYPLLGNGDAQAAICQRTYCPRTFTAGVRRSWTLDHYLAFPRFLVVKRALDLGFYPRNVLIHVALRATLALALPAA